MPDPDDRSIALPLHLVERAIGAGEQHSAAVRDLLAALDLHERAAQARHTETRPALEAYAEHLAELRQARNNAVAEQVEGRSRLVTFLRSRAMVALYTALAGALSWWLSQRLPATLSVQPQEAADHAG